MQLIPPPGSARCPTFVWNYLLHYYESQLHRHLLGKFPGDNPTFKRQVVTGKGEGPLLTWDWMTNFVCGSIALLTTHFRICNHKYLLDYRDWPKRNYGNQRLNQYSHLLYITWTNTYHSLHKKGINDGYIKNNIFKGKSCPDARHSSMFRIKTWL